jgi:hypothetical protein
VSGQHVIVGSDYANVGAIHHPDNGLVISSTRCHAMRQIPAVELTAMHGLGRHRIDISPILIPQQSAAGGDVLSHTENVWMHVVSLSPLM